MSDLILKRNRLTSILKKYQSLAVAFSGGVDSTFLLAMANSVNQGAVPLIAITAVSPLHSRQDIDAALAYAEENGIRHILVHTHETDSDEFLRNPPDRCYICKKIIFGTIFEASRKMGIKTIAHGVNIDDTKDYRPGLKAAEEMGAVAPLHAAGMTKEDIRRLSKEMNLSTWDKPSSGCLATRIPYGEPVTEKKLKMVEAAENVLSTLGFRACRVRHYGETAKVEVLPDHIERMIDPDIRIQLIEKLKKIGFLYITVDLEGYQSGRLNRSVKINA